jgi:regulation of enolase protein 1 (concanavalin A-like superfamily)
MGMHKIHLSPYVEQLSVVLCTLQFLNHSIFGEENMKKQSLFQAWNTDTLDQSWSWVREDTTAWSLENTKLSLKTLPGTLWGENNTARNILLRPETSVESGFSSEVTVTNKPEYQGEQAGLIWYNDNANYIKLVKESLGGQVWIVLAREQADTPVLVAKFPIHTMTVCLRLTFMDDMVTGWVKPAGSETWSRVGECSLVNDSVTQPGVFTHGAPADSDRWVTLSHFQIYHAR